MTKCGLIVLCTGNSCRSQMAEAFLRAKVGDRFSVFSAGTDPAAQVHPLAIRVMAERAIDISENVPRHVDDYLGRVSIDTAILVCDGANASCPASLPGVSQRLFWPFDDPAKAQGADEDRLRFFRRVRDEIEARIDRWLAEGVG